MKDEPRSVKVSIFDKEYEVKGSSDEGYIGTLAAYVDSIMRDIASRTGTPSSGRIAILAALNVADEMFKERQRFKESIEKLDQELERALES